LFSEALEASQQLAPAAVEERCSTSTIDRALPAE